MWPKDSSRNRPRLGCSGETRFLHTSACRFGICLPLQIVSTDVYRCLQMSTQMSTDMSTEYVWVLEVYGLSRSVVTPLYLLYYSEYIYCNRRSEQTPTPSKCRLMSRCSPVGNALFLNRHHDICAESELDTTRTRTRPWICGCGCGQ